MPRKTTFREEKDMTGLTIERATSRRTVLRAAASAATSIVLSAPFVRGAFAAGKLSVGFWDHWVPGGNNTLTKLCNEWADKNQVEIAIDYITSQGDKLLLTGAAEAQAKSGHDMLTFRSSPIPSPRPGSPTRSTPRPRCRR
jgi:ABC-type glycerol-3-phosphate transport system substrate-binding protein